ncbi:MAG: sulfatase [Akkermansiaceae bacterium]|nr:sulfatase [Akkermansiaceae bacterium]
MFFFNSLNLLISGLILLGSYSAAAAKKPNILLIIADDMTWSDCQPYGSPNVKTPHLQKLANQGMRFDGMFTGTAMCSPTRQQLYTGIFPIRNGAFANHSQVHKGVKSIVHHLSELGYRVSLEGKKHIGPQQSFPFKNLNLAKVLATTDKPFCHIVASHDPHKPWTTGDATAFDPAKLVVPPNLIDTPEVRQQLCHYYAEISHLDTTVGKILKSLEQAGVAKNTLVIFTTEQGMTLPFGGKWLCYDTGLKTGFLVRWPGVVKPGSSTSALTQYVDVVPTLVEIAGGDPTRIDTGCADADGKHGFDGRSFLSILKGENDQLRNYVYGIQTTKGIFNGHNYPVRSVRNQRYQYIRNLNHQAEFNNSYTEGGVFHREYYLPLVAAAKDSPAVKSRLALFKKRPYEELYDLTKDPYELHNLANSPELLETKKKLSDALDAFMRQQNDRGIETEEKCPSRLGRAQ